MSIWKFSKPKNPGFGINKNFYLTVLAARASLPSIKEVIHPKGEGGAIPGYGAPLSAQSTKDDLDRPLLRGAYALASMDKKTVIKMLVVSKDEAGFDPEPLLRSDFAEKLSPELIERVRATWTVLQLTFESHDAMVYPALDFLLLLVKRLGELSDGVIADPISRRYLLPTEVIHPRKSGEPYHVLDSIECIDQKVSEGISVFTLGMQKFALPEIEINMLEPEAVPGAKLLLYHLSHEIISGKLLRVGDNVGTNACEFEVVPGGLDRVRWEGIPCLELVPGKKFSSSDAVRDVVSQLKLT